MIQTNTEEVSDTEAITGEDIAFIKTSLDDTVKAVYSNYMYSGKTETEKKRRL